MVMSTVQSVLSIALGKIGIIGAGATPDTNDNARALQALKAYYQHLINAGAFGALTDIIPQVTVYEAGENERIVRDGTQTTSVVLPVNVPFYYETSDYGVSAYVTNISLVRPISNRRMLSAPRSALRCAAVSKPASNDDRMTFRSSDIGLASIQSLPPKAAAWLSLRKLHVIASFSPRAAALRRTLRSIFWIGVAVGFATPSARGSGVDTT